MSDLLQYKGYHGTVAYNSEDNMLVGSVVGVQDSLNYNGNSIDEITAAFQNCIDEYLEICRAIGKEPDKEYKGSFNVRIPQELHRQADLEAKKRQISLNQFVQEAIRDKLYPQTPAYFITTSENIRVTEMTGISNASDYVGV